MVSNNHAFGFLGTIFQTGSISFMKSVRIIAGVAVCFAFVFSWLFAFTLFNRLYIYFNRDQYKVESFEVADAVYLPNRSREGIRSYWLTGTVAGHRERLLPEFPPTFKPTRAEDLLTLFPRGSTIPVLYHPGASETIVQGETLRVFHFTPGFWPREDRLRIKLICWVLLPVPLALALYRYLNKRAYVLPNIRWPNR